MSKTKNYKKKNFYNYRKKNSSLKKIQQEEGYYFIEHDKSIGGRYSVFSVVGLLPAALSSFNIKNFVRGKKFLSLIENDNFFLILLFFFISNDFTSKKGVNISVIMPYIDNLNNLSFWYKQLWAESIGKKKWVQPLLIPLEQLTSIASYSFFLDGPRDKFYTIIGRKKKKKAKFP